MSITGSSETVPRSIGSLASGVGVLMLVAWGIDPDRMQSILPEGPRMSPGTLTLSVLSGVALHLVGRTGDRGAARTATVRPGILLGLAVAGLAGYRLGVHLLDGATGIDQLWLSSRSVDAGSISPLTAVSFLLIGCALALSSSTGPWKQVIFQALTAGTLLCAAAGFDRYVYGGLPLTVLADMSLPTSIMVLGLGIGTAAARPDLGLARLIGNNGLDSWLTRRMLPAAILVPTGTGWLSLRGHLAGWYSIQTALSLVVLINVCLFTAMIWITAVLLGRVDHGRLTAEEGRDQVRGWLQAISDNAPTGIGVKDLDGRYLMANRQLAQFLGLPTEDLLGHTDQELFPGPVAAGIRERDERALAAGAPITQDAPSPRGDGTYISVRCPLHDDAGAAYALCEITTDITNRAETEHDLRESEERYRSLNTELEVRVHERTQELEFVNAELESFTYSVSHDLRAPLRTIAGFCMLLTRSGEDRFTSEDLRILGRIDAGAHEMSVLIESLLALSTAGRQALNRQPVDMARMAERVLSTLTAGLDGRRVTTTVTDLPAAVADLVLIKQVLVNLIGNAIKYSAGNSDATIEIGYEAGEDEPVYFVRDNGAGFDMRHADRLFGAFQRMHSVDQFEGTGIGLSIVERIIRRHGGRIWAQSEVTRGATFFFTLPPPTPIGTVRLKRVAVPSQPRSTSTRASVMSPTNAPPAMSTLTTVDRR